MPACIADLPRLLRLCAAPLLALCGTFIYSSSYAQAGADCNPQGNTAQINACAVLAFQQADSALNIEYLNVMQTLRQDARTALRHEQNRWIKQRVVDCKAAHRAQENQADWPRLYHQCLLHATEARRPVLDAWGKKSSTP